MQCIILNMLKVKTGRIYVYQNKSSYPLEEKLSIKRILFSPFFLPIFSEFSQMSISDFCKLYIYICLYVKTFYIYIYKKYIHTPMFI